MNVTGRPSGGGMMAAAVLVAAIAATLVVAPVAGADPPRVESPWSWADRGPQLRAVSCPAPGRCVAVGDGGAVLRSSGDAGSPAAWARVTLAADDDALTAVTCTDARCLAISGAEGDKSKANPVSQVFRSLDGGATWSAGVPLPPAHSGRTRVGDAIDCDPAATRICTVVGSEGGIWRSTDDGVTWTALAASDPKGSFDGIACPAAGVCIAIGNASSSSKADPRSVVLRGTAASPMTWPTTGAPTAIACESASTCTAADSGGSVTSTSAPWKAWGTPVKLPGKETHARALACPVADACVGLTGTGSAVRTTARASGVWTRALTGSADLAALDCIETTCVAVGDHATWYGSADTGRTWTQGNEVVKLDVVDCPTGAGNGTCMAGGGEDVATSSAAGDLWTTPLSGITTLDVKGVTCADHPTCLALGKGRTLITPDFGRAWGNRLPAGGISSGPEHFACVTSVQCHGVGGGAIYTTYDGAQTGWKLASVPAPKEALVGISCPAALRCVVATAHHVLRGSLDPSGGEARWSWTAADVESDEPLAAVSCSASSCTAVGTAGVLYTTTDATLLEWTRLELHSAPDKALPFGAVSCPADGVCVAGADGGWLASTTTNWETWSLDELPKPTTGAPRSFKSFSCPSPTRCVAVGDSVVVGDRASG